MEAPAAEVEIAEQRLQQVRSLLDMENENFELRKEQSGFERSEARRDRQEAINSMTREIIQVRELARLRRVLASTPVDRGTAADGGRLGTGRLAVLRAAEAMGIQGSDIAGMGDAIWKLSATVGDGGSSAINALSTLMANRAQAQQQDIEFSRQLPEKITEQYEAAKSAFAAQSAELQKQIDALETAKSGASDAEIAALNRQIESLQKQNENLAKQFQDEQGGVEQLIEQRARLREKMQMDGFQEMESVAKQIADSIRSAIDQFWQTEQFIREKQIELFGEQYPGQGRATKTAGQYAGAIGSAATVGQIGRIVQLARTELGGTLRDPMILNMLKDAVAGRKLDFEQQAIQRDSYYTLRDLLRTSIQSLEQLRAMNGQQVLQPPIVGKSPTLRTDQSVRQPDSGRRTLPYSPFLRPGVYQMPVSEINAYLNRSGTFDGVEGLFNTRSGRPTSASRASGRGMDSLAEELSATNAVLLEQLETISSRATFVAGKLAETRNQVKQQSKAEEQSFRAQGLR